MDGPIEAERAQEVGAILLFVLALVVFALARVTGNPADLLLPEDAAEYVERARKTTLS